MRKVNHYWTTKQLERFQELYREHSLTVCRDKLNEEFQLNLSINQLKAATSNHNIRSGRTGCFPKGSTPWNKGKRFDCPGSRATRFKKGNRPQTYLPVGSEVVRTDGYLAVKVADPNKWRLKHRLIWEETHGPIPRGYVLLFLNQDKTDVRLENLVLIKRSRLAVANRYGLLSQSAELTKSGLLVAEVKHKAHNLKQKSKGILTHEDHCTTPPPAEAGHHRHINRWREGMGFSQQHQENPAGVHCLFLGRRMGPCERQLQ